MLADAKHCTINAVTVVAQALEIEYCLILNLYNMK